MPEGVLRLPCHRRLPGRTNELLPRELAQGAGDRLRVALAHRRHRPRPEDFADHRGIGNERLRIGFQGVQTGGDQRLHRLREGDFRPLLELPTRANSLEQVTVFQQAHELLGVQRVAPGPLEDRLLQLHRDDGGLEQR